MKRLLATLAVVFLCLPASAAVLYTPHFVQFFDDDGDPCNGCKLYTYTAGTTTPKATYTTAAGSIANANPVVMDASGRAVIFLSGSYKFRLETSSGSLIRETDNVTAFSAQTGSVDDIVTNFTEAVVASGDSVIFADASDSNTTKRDTVDGVVDVVASTLAAKTDTVIASDDKLMFFDFSSSDLPKTDTVAGLLDLSKVTQRAYAEYLTSTDLTTTIPLDDTIPQNTEGTEILSASITPKSATNRVRARFQGIGGSSASGKYIIAALFKDSTADALCTSTSTQVSNDVPTPVILECEFVPGDTSAHTYKIRVGPDSAATIRMNGDDDTRYFGGSARATLILEEIVP